jgi:DNA mismatch repair protein MutS
VLNRFNVDNLSELGGLEEGSIEASCVCGLLDYISETQKALVGRFTEIKKYNDNRFMELDLTARRNLNCAKL